MSDYGLTDSGFNKKTLNTIKTEVNNRIKAKYPQINLSDETIFGQINNLFAELFADLWDITESVYNSQNPFNASGQSLDLCGATQNKKRYDKKLSTIDTVVLWGDSNAIIPAGIIFNVSGSDTLKFSLDETVMLIGGTDGIINITASGIPSSGSLTFNYKSVETDALDCSSFAASSIQTLLNGIGINNVTVTNTAALTYKLIFSKQLVDSSDITITTNTTGKSFLIGLGTAGAWQGVGSVTALEYGVVDANLFTMNEITTPVIGLTAVRNESVIDLGRNVETDEEFRARILSSAQISKSGTVNGIRQALLNLNEAETDTGKLLSVKVLENVTDSAIGSFPSKSFQVYVYYEDAPDADKDQIIAETIWIAKPAGMQAFGTVTATVTDEQGIDQGIAFSRPVNVPIYVIISATASTGYPTTLATAIKTAIVEWGQSLGAGEDARVNGYNGLTSVLNNISSVVDYNLKIGKTNPPTTANNINIDDGTGGTVEISTWSATNITVTIS